MTIETATLTDEEAAIHEPDADIFRSAIDGEWIVQIDTPLDGDDVPRLRVYLNDGTIWNNGPAS